MHSFLKHAFRRTAGIDPRSLAAFRIGLGVLLLWDIALALGSVRAFYSDQGFLPLASLPQFEESPWLWSIHSWSGSTAWQVTLLLLHMTAALCLLAGFHTRVAVAVCWVLLCSLHARNQIVLHSGDMVLRLLLFWSMMLPLGARWSADACLRKREADGVGLIATWPGLGILIQIAIIYWAGVALKSGPEWVRDGTAVYYALCLDQFVTVAGRRLLEFPVFDRVMTFSTWWLELIGPALAFVPWRNGCWRMVAVVSFWVLHAGLWVCLRLGPFPLTMIVAWTLFLPPGFWDKLGPRGLALADGTAADANPSGNAPRRRWWTSTVVQACGFISLLYVTLWNIRSIDPARWTPWFPQWMNPAGYALHLPQYWTMFAPGPTKDDGWLIMEARLADGSHVDLLREGRPVSFEKPAVISAEFRDTKWQKLMVNLWRSRYQKARPLVGNWFAFEWNGSHPAALQIKGWTLWYMREDTPPPGTPPVAIQKMEIQRSGSL
ncbi:MAG: HTTM domain-containing protein [Verrucomicrobiaceae bacterium]|nr:HTTM domain-containing protein [Verrucomicrobiaceae bacterium]